jgi:hypothetical protein
MNSMGKLVRQSLNRKLTLGKSVAIFLIIIFTITLLSAPQIFGQISNTWYKTFGGEYGGRIASVIQTADGGYTLVGFHKFGLGYPTPDAQDTWLIKVNPKGDTFLDKKFNLGLNDQPVGGILVSNGNYVIVGDTPGGFTGTDGSTILKTCYLLTLDSLGNRIWNQTFFGEQGWKITQASNGEDYAVLTINQNPRDGFYLRKFVSGLQSPVWVTSFDEPGDLSWVNDLTYTSDGGFIVAGKFWGKSEYPTSVWIVKFDSQGNIQQNKTITDILAVDALVQTEDGGYMLASGNEILKIDSYLNVQWKKTVSIGYAQSITKTSDGGYAVGVQDYYTDEDDSAVGIVKVDTSGNPQWTKWFNGTRIFKLIQTNDGGYALVGEIAFRALGTPYGLFIKTDANGDTEGQITLPTPTPTPTIPPETSPTPSPFLNQTLNQTVVLGISSNSTVSAFAINNTVPSINFSVSGPTGTTGYVKITIAKSFMPNSNIKVYLDGKETSYQLEEKEDSLVITFTYTHSQHQVTILQVASDGVSSEFPEWVWQATLIGVASGLAVAGCVVYWVAKKKV